MSHFRGGYIQNLSALFKICQSCYFTGMNLLIKFICDFCCTQAVQISVTARLSYGISSLHVRLRLIDRGGCNFQPWLSIFCNWQIYGYIDCSSEKVCWSPSLTFGGLHVGFSQRWDFITPFRSSAALYSHWEILNIDSESFNERGDVR